MRVIESFMCMNNYYRIIAISFLLISSFIAQEEVKNIHLPEKGICAHRGANQTHPENTLAAFSEAVKLGAHMIEFDVRMSKDSKLVIIHDESVDRTTDGSGFIRDLTLEEIKSLDAGSWKSEDFEGERIPSLSEVLEIMPQNIWLNIHLKGDQRLGEAVAKMIVEKRRKHQTFIACGSDTEVGVRKIDSKIMVCNMERQENREEYVSETIKGNYPFIQLLKKREDDELLKDVQRLKMNGIKINFYHAETIAEARELFDMGVDFVLTDNLNLMMNSLDKLGIKK